MAQRRVELEVQGASPIPEEWEKMVAACLNKDATRRPESVRDIMGMLGYFFSGDLGAPLPPSARGMKRKTVATLVLTVVLSLGLVWAIYNYRVVIPRQRELQQQAELTREAQQTAEAKARQLVADKAEAVQQAEQKRQEAERQRLLAEQQALARESTLKQEIAQQSMKQSSVQADYDSLKQQMQRLQTERVTPPPAPAPAPVPTYVPAPSRTDTGPWIFPDSSRRLISHDELRQLSASDLWKARNEIYARHGYIFQTDRGKSYTRSLGSYYERRSSSQSAVENSFNATETENVERIKSHE